MNTPAPPAAGPPPALAIPPASHAADGNILLAFEETIRLFPAAAQTIAVERKTGTPAQWMITSRPRTANELYDAIKLLHGRAGETTYEVTFRDGAGHGNGGQVSMPSTLGDPLPPGAPAVPQPYPPPYAPPYAQMPTAYAAPPMPPAAPIAGAPFDANTLLTMQRQLFEMMQAMAPKPVTAPPPMPPAAPPQAPVDQATPLLAMQKQLFEMMQAMQATAAGHAPPPPPPPQPMAPPPPATAPPDPAAAMLAMQKQLFEMMQAMQATAAGHARPAHPATPPVFVAPPPATDPTTAMLTMQKQMFEMMLTMMQTAQRGAGASPAGGPYYRPRYPGPSDPRDPNAPPYDPRSPYSPPARPQTPSQQLREAASVFRDTIEVAREFGFGGAAAEPPPPEDDDSPVRVIDMGPAKGVINREDGSLRGVETFMANLPDILKWVGEQRAEIRKANEKRQEQQQLPPGYVRVGPGYEPPEGFVAVPVDQIPSSAQEALPEPPAEMPPPIAEPPPAAAPPKRAWGMPR
ncbi:MAG TPA: hypothetical protein VK587_15815 [bacterium]|nr:hypothetical protein [bacterium]